MVTDQPDPKGLEYVLSAEHADDLMRRAVRIARLCGLITLGVGALVIIGWAVNAHPLQTVLPNAVSMKFNTAVGFVLLGFALVGQTTASARVRLLATVAAGVALLIGALALAEYALGRDLGIDQIFIRDMTTSWRPSAAGRMAPHTSLALIASGLAILMLDRPVRGRYWLPEALAALVASLAIFALGGHLFGARGADRLPFSAGMALHSAIAFLFVTAGLFAMRPKHGFAQILFSPTITGKVGRRSFLGALVIPLAIGLLAVRLEVSRILDPASATALLIGLISLVLAGSVVLETSMANRLEHKRLDLERERDRLILELETALAEVRTLSGLLPICGHCKRIRDDGGAWERVEVYISDHSEAEFSHSVCPDCMVKHYADTA